MRAVALLGALSTLFPIIATAYTCNITAYSTQISSFDVTESLQAALDNTQCDEVLVTGPGTIKAGALHVKRSHVTLTLASGATLQGDSKKVKQCDDEQKWQPDGWCAFITVSSAANFTLRGSGTLEQGGSQGVHYSALHIVSTVGVVLGNGDPLVSQTPLRIHCTNSWWCSALHNASSVHVRGLYIDGSKGRDGMDLVNCRDVLIEDSRIDGSDDGLCFKTQADTGLSAWQARDVVVRNAQISSQCCNAIMFGSRTEVDMHNFTFHNITISSGRKSAIGIVSMDSANISALSFDNITIHGDDVATPLFMKLGNREKGEYGDHHWTVGSIRDVNFTNIRADFWGHAKASSGRRSSYTATIEGRNASFRVGPIRINSFDISAPGGGKASDAERDPPNSASEPWPRDDGVRPSWGWFVRHATDILFQNCALDLQKGISSDGRPAIVLDDVEDINWVAGNAHVIAGAGCQLRTRDINGYNHLNETGLQSCAWLPTPGPTPTPSPTEPTPPPSPTPPVPTPTPPVPTPASGFAEHNKAYCGTSGAHAERVFDDKGVELGDCAARCAPDPQCSCYDHRDKDDTCRLYHGSPALVKSSDGYSAWTRS